MSKQSTPLQARIERTAAKLATLKAQQQAAEAREKARRQSEVRATRNRALVLWGIALERQALNAPDGNTKIRALLERHLTRENERTAALNFLNAIERSVIEQPST